MNKHIALIPIVGLALLTVVGCGTGAHHNPITNSTTNTSSTSAASTSSTNTSGTNTSGTNTVPTSAASTSNINTVSTPTASTSNAKAGSTSTANTPVHADSSSTAYTSEIALIKGKRYDVIGAKPNASVQTSSGDALTAWIGVAMHSDGHNQYVFFFLNGKYLGTDTAKPSLGITSAKAAGNGIAVTYPVYKEKDAFADPTGTPVTITYTWNGSKLVPNKPYPKQFG